jgi:hypothetical protein
MIAVLNKHRDIVDRAGEYEFSMRWMEAKQAWLEARLPLFAWKMAGAMLAHPILSLNRMILAMPNFGLNRAFSRFHLRGGE